MYKRQVWNKLILLLSMEWLWTAGREYLWIILAYVVAVGFIYVVFLYIRLSLIHISPITDTPKGCHISEPSPPPIAIGTMPRIVVKVVTVSYTHLDVYKRQLLPCPEGRGILSGSDLMVDLPAMIDSYTLQPSIPSDGGTVTTASPRHS